MKVAKLIDKLKKSNPDAEVAFSYSSDNPMESETLTEVIEIIVRGDDATNTTVVLRS